MLHVIAGGVMLASGSSDLFDIAVKGIKLSIVGSIAYSALVAQPWLGQVTGIGGAITLPDAIMTGFYQLMGRAGATLGWQVDGNSTGAFFNSMVSTMANAIFRFVDMPILNQDQGFWRRAVSILDPANLVAMLYWFVSVLVFVLACAMLLFEILGAELTIQFAIAFTPLMVPWMLFRPMEFLFNSWLRMLIVGGLGYVAGILMISGFASFANRASILVQQSRADSMWEGAGAAMVMLPVFLGSIIFMMLASKANSIASSLVSGGGVDGISLNTIRNGVMAMNTGARAPSQTAGHALNGLSNVGRGASRVVGAGASAAAGLKSAGQSGLNAFRSATASPLSSTPGGKAQAIGQGIASGGKAFGQSIASSVSNAGSTVSKAELNSPGGKAVQRMAKAMGNEASLTPPMMKAAISHSNKAFATARGEGQLGSQAKVATQKAAGEWLKAVSRNPKSPPPAAPPGPSIIKTKTP
jgi:hypothetical protein